MPALTLQMSRPQSQPSSPPLAGCTNTVVLANVPQHFFHPRIIEIIKGYFTEYGQIHSFAPLKAFGRVIIVYYEDEYAERAKQCLDGIQLGGTDSHVTLRVFRAQPTPISPTEDIYLAPPSPTKNFLISPPGSPPVGWEQIREEPPNATPLADDLIIALSRLQAEQEFRGGREKRMKDGCEVLWHADETPAGVGIYVEDCAICLDKPEGEDEDEEMEGTGERLWYGSAQERKFGLGRDSLKGVMMSMPRTAMPTKTSMPTKTAIPPRLRW